MLAQTRTISIVTKMNLTSYHTVTKTNDSRSLQITVISTD